MKKFSPVRISPCEESRSAGGALWLDIVLLQDQARLGEVEEVGGLHSGVVPGHVVITQVVGQDQEDVGTALLVSWQSLLFNEIFWLNNQSSVLRKVNYKVKIDFIEQFPFFCMRMSQAG